MNTMPAITALSVQVAKLGGDILALEITTREGEQHMGGRVLWTRTLGNNVTEFVTHVWGYDSKEDAVHIFNGHYIRGKERKEDAHIDYQQRKF